MQNIIQLLWLIWMSFMKEQKLTSELTDFQELDRLAERVCSLLLGLTSVQIGRGRSRMMDPHDFPVFVLMK